MQRYDNKTIFMLFYICMSLLPVFGSAKSRRYTEVAHETVTINDSLRSEIDSTGSYASLTLGKTFYKISGQDSGDVVILIHGASLASWVWDNQVASLEKAGYKILRYDQYSRGLSDYPLTTYDINLYRNQLHELIKTLKISNKVHLVGHSFGGFIIASYLEKYPNDVKSVTLIAPGIRTSPGINFLINTPLARWHIHRNLRRIPKTIESTLLSEGIPLIPYKKQYLAQWQTKGYEYAMISLFENAVGNFISAYSVLEKQGIPSQIIWGTDDPQAKEKYVLELLEAVPTMHNHQIESGHNPQFSETKKLNTLLIQFLKEHSQKLP